MTSSRSVDASSWSLFVSHLAVWCVHHIIVSPLKNVVRFLSNQNYTLPPLSFIAHNQNGHRKIVQPSFRPSQREHLTLFNKCVTRRSFYQIPGKSSAPNRSSMNSERCIIRLIKKMFQFILKVSAFCHFESECESVKILQTGTMTNQMTVDGPDLLENCSFITGIRTHSAQKSNTPQFFRLSIQFCLCVGSCSMLLLGRKGQSHWGPRVVESEKKKPRA